MTTNVIVLSFALITNAPKQTVIGHTAGGNPIVAPVESVEQITELGFKAGNGIFKRKEIISLGQSRKTVSSKTWSNLAVVAAVPVNQPPVPKVAVTNTLSRGQLMRAQRERERTNTVKAKQ